MNNKGRVVAMDVLETRLDRSAQRLRRAGAHNVERRASIADNAKWLKRQKRRLRPRAGRRAVHRHRHVAAQSRRPLDARARGPRRAGAQAGRHPRRRGAAGEAGRRAGLRHLLGAAGRERAPDRGLPRAPSRVSPSCRSPTSGAMPASEPPPSRGPYLRLSPLRHGTDGFFAAALVRKDPAPRRRPRTTEDPEAPTRRRPHDPHPPRPPERRRGDRPGPCRDLAVGLCRPAARRDAGRHVGRAPVGLVVARARPIPARRAASSWPTTRTWAWSASAAAGRCATCPKGSTAPRSGSARSTRSMSSPTSRTRGWAAACSTPCSASSSADGCDTAMLWMLADNPTRFFYEGLGGAPVGRPRRHAWPAPTSRRWPTPGATSTRRWSAASSRPRKSGEESPESTESTRVWTGWMPMARISGPEFQNPPIPRRKTPGREVAGRPGAGKASGAPRASSCGPHCTRSAAEHLLRALAPPLSEQCAP